MKKTKEAKKVLRDWGREYEHCHPQMGWAGVSMLVIIAGVLIQILEILEKRKEE